MSDGFRPSSTRRNALGAVVSRTALSGLIGVALMAPAQASCFSASRPSLPTVEKVRGTLSNGEAGEGISRTVGSGDIGAVAALVQAQPDLLSTRTVLPEGQRPYDGNLGDLLTFAVANCDARMLGALLELGADPDGAVPGLALTYAALADDLTMATMLLQAGARPDASTPATSPALGEVLYNERADAVALLARFGAGVNRSDTFGGTPLASALRFQDWPSARALMNAGANPWQVGNKGMLPAFTLFAGGGPRDRQARDIHADLLARVRAQGPIWPPPRPDEVARRVLDGTWPTPAMRRAGFVVSDGAIRSMRIAFPRAQ